MAEHHFKIKNTKRGIALSSLLALLIYLAPNMVQDLHRVFGHHHHHCESHSGTGILLVHAEKCAVCVFEFNIVDEPTDYTFIPLPQFIAFKLPDAIENQFINCAFQYYNLRAPPLV